MREKNLEVILSNLEGTIYEELEKNFNAFLVSICMASHPGLQNIFLKTQNSFQKSIIRFNKDIKLKEETDEMGNHLKCNYKPMLDFQGIMMGIIIFEILQNSKFNKILNRKEIFKFAKHIRNGCAHNNKFNFEKPLKNPIIWNQHKIDNNLQGKQVVPSFITTFDMLFLALDIIKEIDSNKKKECSIKPL